MIYAMTSPYLNDKQANLNQLERYGLKAQKTTAQGTALGTYTYEDGALKEQKMKPWMLVGSSYALTERHHNEMYIIQGVALGCSLLGFQPVP